MLGEKTDSGSAVRSIGMEPGRHSSAWPWALPCPEDWLPTGNDSTKQSSAGHKHFSGSVPDSLSLFHLAFNMSVLVLPCSYSALVSPFQGAVTCCWQCLAQLGSDPNISKTRLHLYTHTFLYGEEKRNWVTMTCENKSFENEASETWSGNYLQWRFIAFKVVNATSW